MVSLELPRTCFTCGRPAADLIGLVTAPFSSSSLPLSGAAVVVAVTTVAALWLAHRAARQARIIHSASAAC